MRLGVIQCEIKDPVGFEDLRALYPQIEADLVVAPELVITGERLLGEDEYARRLKILHEMVAARGVPLLAGALDPQGPLNKALLFTREGVCTVAEKVNPFPGFDVKIGVKPGLQPTPFLLAGKRLGVVICFDLRFPEITRRLVNRGAETILVLAAWPRERISHFHRLLAARAIENQVFVAGINAFGEVVGFDLAGESILFDPLGRERGKLSGKAWSVFETDEEALEEARKLFVTSRLAPPGPPEKKILPLAELLEEVKWRRRLGQKMVFTNGCFDLLHAGHVTYLHQARRQGDFLVLGLNSDESVRRLKGASRPIIPQQQRATVLAGLESVDYVVFFDDDTPEALIRALKPDVLVKGADWPEEKIVGASFVRSYGGQVVRIPFEFSVSTSQIIERIRRQDERA